MNFEDIYKPVSKELNEVEVELKNISKTLGSSVTQEIFEHFFRMPGKHLRPTLVLLAAGAVNDNLSEEVHSQLIDLAVAIELIHSASLVHDDIIDGDLLRRGQKTLNNVYGRKISILAGDALYSRSFYIFATSIPKELEKIIGQVTERMSLAEIEQAKFSSPSREEYLNVIKGKTALLMSASCQLGAAIVGGSEVEVKSLEEFGLNVGMAYQVLDDYMDGDPNAVNNVTLDDAHKFVANAIEALNKLKDSVYKEKLIALINFLLNFSHAKAENA